jgi:hypothetical protein
MNNQEFFDKTVAHLRTQKVPCYVETGGGSNCLYVKKTEDGKVLHCAVGAHFEPSMLREPGFVGDVDTLFSGHQQIKALFDGVSRPLLKAAQQLHDSASPGSDYNAGFNTFEGEAFEQEVHMLAARFGLVYTPPAGTV